MRKEQESLASEIRKKFGTVANFCRLIGVSPYKFKLDYLSKKIIDNKKINAIRGMVRKWHPVRGKALSKDDIQRLREAILKYGGVKAFCTAHPKFKFNTLYAILNSDQYARITDTVVDLFKTLKLKL